MNRSIKLYFDACCYNRPFDNLQNEKVRLEAEAVLMIQGRIGIESHELYSSRAVEFELSKTKDISKKMNVLVFYDSVQKTLLDFHDNIEFLASDYESYNIRYMDALHIAYCDFNKMDYMLTTDKGLINAARRVQTLVKVINPLEFVMEVL